uniref:Uncharacterized protein n=1 Tax=Anopheles funestus TaxID=62324 RepID=A0A182S1S7_ANOFN
MMGRFGSASSTLVSRLSIWVHFSASPSCFIFTAPSSRFPLLAGLLVSTVVQIPSPSDDGSALSSVVNGCPPPCSRNSGFSSFSPHLPTSASSDFGSELPFTEVLPFVRPPLVTFASAFAILLLL